MSWYVAVGLLAVVGMVLLWIAWHFNLLRFGDQREQKPASSELWLLHWADASTSEIEHRYPDAGHYLWKLKDRVAPIILEEARDVRRKNFVSLQGVTHLETRYLPNLAERWSADEFLGQAMAELERLSDGAREEKGKRLLDAENAKRGKQSNELRDEGKRAKEHAKAHIAAIAHKPKKWGKATEAKSEESVVEGEDVGGGEAEGEP